MKRWIYILTLLLLPMKVWTNGDPVAEFCALTLSKAPVPRAIPEIQIERENLHITLEYGQAHISVDYVLHNTSKKSFRDIYYGFPVDWEGDSLVHWVGDFYTESQYQKGWSDDYVRDFSFSLDGKALSANMSGDTLLKPAYTAEDWHKEFGYPDWHNFMYDTAHHKYNDDNDPYNWCEILSEYEWDSVLSKPLVLEESVHRRWYYTKFSLRAGKSATLHVEYTLNHSLWRGLYRLGEEFQRAFEGWANDYQGSEWISHAYNNFRYDFSPAAAWGDGTTPELDLKIDAPNTEVWLYDQNWRDTCLFVNHYYQHYTDFHYADTTPLNLKYYYPLPDSFDVNSIRDHRLSPMRYSLRQYEGDTCHYDALSDLDGCTGVFLNPNDSGEYVLEIVLTDSIPITGLAILHGNYCDSLSWVTTPRAEKMQVDYWIAKPWDILPRSYPLYSKTEWITKWIEANHYPALCKTEQPTDFTWPSLVRSMEKINIGNRGFESEIGHYREENVYTHLIRIRIPHQESAPFISEVILLYNDRHYK